MISISLQRLESESYYGHYESPVVPNVGDHIQLRSRKTTTDITNFIVKKVTYVAYKREYTGKLIPESGYLDHVELKCEEVKHEEEKTS